MTATLAQPKIRQINVANAPTAEEWLRLEREAGLEYSDGELQEHDMGRRSNRAAVRIASSLLRFEGGVYESYADSLPYRCFPDDPNRVRKPDASAILLNRIREAELSDDFRICTIAPDLAVEVVSPTDNARRLDAKVQEYLAAGVPRVWVVWPEADALTEYGPDHHHRRYAADEEVTLPHLHPEYRARVGSFFD